MNTRSFLSSTRSVRRIRYIDKCVAKENDVCMRSYVREKQTK